MILQLLEQIPVTVTAKPPEGVNAGDGRGWCIAWERPGPDSHMLWIVVLDASGHVLHVPQTEIRVDVNWSMQRRYQQEGAPT